MYTNKIIGAAFSIFLLSSSTLFFSQCSAQSKKEKVSVSTDTLYIPYNIDAPDIIITLNDELLKEVSGLGPTNVPGEFVAIADEQGEIYFLLGNNVGKVARTVRFHDKGDFESVEMVNRTLYAVQSNGKVYEVTDWEDSTQMKVNKYETSLSKTNDIEGMCYDPKRNALLLVCKEDPEVPGPRNIWAFDLKTKQLGTTPVYSLSSDLANNIVALNDQDKHASFSPSGIAIHPVSGDLYLLSSALKRLVVVDYTSGQLKSAVRLDKQLMPQPEGIAFDADATLYICSEGKKSNGILLRYKYLPKGQK